MWSERQEIAVPVGPRDRAISIDSGVLAIGANIFALEDGTWVPRWVLEGDVGTEAALDGDLLVTGIRGSDTTEDAVTTFDLGTLGE